MQKCVHHTFERGWGITQAERHDFELVQAIRCYKCCLLAVHVVYSNLPVAGPKVDGRKIFRTVKAVQRVIDAWERVNIFFSYLVQVPIVHTETPGVVLLLTRTTGDAHGLEDGSMIPRESIFSTSV